VASSAVVTAALPALWRYDAGPPGPDGPDETGETGDPDARQRDTVTPAGS
jgi:hypothetical protein